MNVALPLKGRLRGTPLRIKLVAAVLVLVAAALVVISVMTAFFLRSYLIGRIDGELATFARDANEQQVQRLYDELLAGRSALPTDYLIVRADREAGVFIPLYDRTALNQNNLPAALDDPEWYERHAGGDFFTVSSADHRFRWRMMVVQWRSGVFLAVGQHLTDVDLAVKELVWIDVLVGGSVLITLAAAGAAIVRTSLKPLVEIERTTAAIAGGDLSRRIPDPEPGEIEAKTELGRLSRALNTMLSQIEVAFTARAASESAARAAEANARSAATAARNAALAAQASESRARRSEERMRQFIADASHELRTPLTTIRGFAELYRQGAVGAPEDTARLIRRIEDESARMGLLVEDLLLLARLDRERPLTLAPVELPVLASDAVQAAKVVAPERPISLEIEPGAGSLVVFGDDARLRQVLGNLMTNALTHTPPDAAVTLRLRVEQSDAVIEVADTGPGLSPEQAERVFERFYRADAARTRQAGGGVSTGLGLAIVAALVAGHNGSVEVVDTPGGGATFRVRLPRAPEISDDPETAESIDVE
ncbi:sensor histidine kinase [Plantactinospora endophytica]|uniref:histidine kinase n=1 Tax=Plantactinospora endophytica TaxID=673535 RepID=A0ABQ4DU25_9ACTN|nr:HAMP domain-containing sensor histidine kinase [Plantactinospora endophytica]GIG85949.1 putative sensor histidine kinase PhoR [Plantactinospora endophytica]